MVEQISRTINSKLNALLCWWSRFNIFKWHLSEGKNLLGCT